MEMGTYNDFYNYDLYDYNELKEKALASDATQEDINALGEWFSRHGISYWNGECFHVDSDHNLYPIQKEIGYDEYELVGYTFSSWDERIIPLPFPTPEARAAWEAEEEEKCRREHQEYEAEKKRKEEFFSKMPVEELVERYDIGFRFPGGANGELITGKMYQAMEDGAENAIWQRRKSIKAFLLSKKEEKA